MELGLVLILREFTVETAYLFLPFSSSSSSISVSVSGSVYDEVLTDKEGDDIVIGFNCRYLLDALRASDGEDIKIDLSNPLVSIIITATKNTEGENYLYMVCPVKMKE